MCIQAIASTYTMCIQALASTYTMCIQALPLFYSIFVLLSAFILSLSGPTNQPGTTQQSALKRWNSYLFAGRHYPSKAELFQNYFLSMYKILRDKCHKLSLSRQNKIVPAFSFSLIIDQCPHHGVPASDEALIMESRHCQEKEQNRT